MKPHLLVPQQVPEFVRADHPGFVEFIQAYYTWLEEYGVVPTNGIGRYLDIDTTVDSFVKQFRKALDVYGMTSNDPSRLYLRHVKDVYTAKGTEEAIQTVLLSMFGKTSSVLNPWDDVFKLSDGKWQQETATVVYVTQGDINTILGEFIYMIDENGTKYQTVVRAITERSDNIYELTISRFTSPVTRFVSISSIDGTVKATSYLSTSKATVQNAGTGFQVGQVFSVDGTNGSKSTIKVKSVDANGGIRAVEIISFGYGFEIDFNIVVAPPGQSLSLGANIQLGGLTYQTNDNVALQRESGEIVRHTYTDLGVAPYMTATYVGQLVGVITPQINAAVDSTQLAYINLSVGSIYRYPGYYIKSDSIVGDLTYIQDSDYYQVYSYVTVVEDTIETYGKLLKQALHPTGTKHFGNYLISDQFQLSPNLSIDLNVIVKSEPLIDFAIIVDDIVFSVGHIITPDEVLIGDTRTFYVTPATVLEAVEVNDVATMLFSKVTADQVVTTDLFNYVFGREIPQTVYIRETITKSSAKYKEEVVELATSGEAALNPYVIDPVIIYGLGGYIENDLAFTN